MNNNLSLPRTAVLELTYQCNHRCLFCSCPWEADKNYKQSEMSTEMWKNVILTLEKAGVTDIALSGGEALMRSDVFELIDFIGLGGMSANLISNGKLLTAEALFHLRKNQFSLSISVPGLETFPFITGNDNLQKVLDSFSLAKKFGVRTTANITVTKRNLPELYENISLPLLYGADSILLNRFLPGGRGLDNTQFLLSREEINRMLDIAEEVLARAGKHGHVGTELPLCVIDNPEKYKHLQVGTQCAAAKDFFVIDPSGYVKVCNHSPTRICRFDEIDKLPENPYWKMFHESKYLPDMCRGCDKNDCCDGGCREAAHVYFGNPNDIDPLFE